MKEKERKKESISIYHILKSIEAQQQYNQKAYERQLEMCETLIKQEKQLQEDLPTTIVESGLDKQLDQIVCGFMLGPKYQRMKRMGSTDVMFNSVRIQAMKSGIDQNLINSQEDSIKKILEEGEQNDGI